MTVLCKNPGCPTEVRDIPNTLEALQDFVGGYIETVTIASDVVIICNEDGRLLDLPYNCSFFGLDLFGPVIVAGVDGDEFADLDPRYAGPMAAAL